MPLVLALEPDQRQAGIIKRVIRDEVKADLLLVDSRDAAIAALNSGVPDVVLLTALMSPRDEEELITHLRGLPGAEHLQTHTIPQLASAGQVAAGPARQGGLLGKFRRKKDAEPIAGCDPSVFAGEVRAYLQRAAELKVEAATQPSGSSHHAGPETQMRPDPYHPVADIEREPEAAAGPSDSWSSPFEWRRSPAQDLRSDDGELPTEVERPAEGSGRDVRAEADHEAELERERERLRLEAEEALERERQRIEAEAAEERERLRAAADAAAERERRRLEAEAAAERERLRVEAEAAARRERERLEAEAAAERERLRLEAEEAAARERERLRLEAEAAAAAERKRLRLEAEAAAAHERERLRREAEAAAARERERLEAEAAAERERLRLEVEAAAERERLRLEVEAAAERERLLVEAAAAAERERLRVEAETAAERERLRAEMELALERELAARAAAAAAAEQAAPEEPIPGTDPFAEFRLDEEEEDGIFRLMPIAAWTRRIEVKRAATEEPQPGDDLRDLMSGLLLPPPVAAVTYPRGCRIRRVRVPPAAVVAAERDKRPVIVSRRALNEARR